jgi:penicillin-binding protein 1C
LVALVPGAQREPKILYPAADRLIALDPDIAEALQRVSFRAQAGQGLSWRLNGEMLAAADADFAWKPQAGMHRIALIDDKARVIAAIRFEVR